MKRPLFAARDDDFLEQQLHAVGDRLQQTLGANAVGSDTHLHVTDDLALGKRQISDTSDHQRRDDRRRS
jgi:hypothetical protein